MTDEEACELIRFHLRQWFRRVPDDVGLATYVSPALDALEWDFAAKFPTRIWKRQEVVQSIETDAGFEATFYYRLERAIYLRVPDHPLLPYLANLMRLRTGAEIYYSNDIGPGLNVQHGSGIVIGPRNVIGRNLLIHQGVTIGQRIAYRSELGGHFGDGVMLFAGAKVLGAVSVGDRVQLAANSVLNQDAEAGMIYAGAPARAIRRVAENAG